MTRSIRLLSALCVIFTLLFGSFGQLLPAVEAAAWQDKVDPWVLTTAQSGETEFLVFLAAHADLSAAATLENKTAKGAFVYQQLSQVAAASQIPVQKWLDTQEVTYQSFWVVNALWVRADFNILQQLAQRPEVAHIYANPQVKLSLPEPPIAPSAPQAPTAIEWNILKINADDVWAAGYTGQGTVVGGADTGYAWNHPALINQYRGWNGASADHNYNWHDATGGSPNTPVDPYGHGTHTMGTMVGDDGGSNQVGVAPGARWIGCRNMDSSGYGTPARYIECYEWFVAPYPIGGNPLTDGDPALAPDVINNSWGCPVGEGCTDPNILLAAVQAVRAAGILTVHSAGNDGSSCSTINTPAAIYAESFSVGAVSSSDVIASFSSRGPVTVDGSNRLKPNISAPGVSIRSSVPGGGYSLSSGTSMAGPHLAGVVALLISASPALAGQVSTLENLIEQSAVPLYSSQGCGGDTLISRPNHTYGWGRVDAWAAYQASFEQEFGLQLTTDPACQGHWLLPGETLTCGPELTNTGNYTDTFNLAVINSYHSAAVTPTLATLGIGQSVALTVTIPVPVDAPGGEVISTTLTAVSAADPNVGGALEITLSVYYREFFPFVFGGQ